VLQLYLTGPSSSSLSSTSVLEPRIRLAGFARRSLAGGESASVIFGITPFQMAGTDSAGNRQILPGTYTVFVGGSQPDLGDGLMGSGEALHTGSGPVKVQFILTGDVAVPLSQCKD